MAAFPTLTCRVEGAGVVSFLQALAVVALLGDGGLWFAAGALAAHPASRNPSPGGTRAPGDKPPAPGTASFVRLSKLLPMEAGV